RALSSEELRFFSVDFVTGGLDADFGAAMCLFLPEGREYRHGVTSAATLGADPDKSPPPRPRCGRRTLGRGDQCVVEVLEDRRGPRYRTDVRTRGRCRRVVEISASVPAPSAAASAASSAPALLEGDLPSCGLRDVHRIAQRGPHRTYGDPALEGLGGAETADLLEHEVLRVGAGEHRTEHVVRQLRELAAPHLSGRRR